MHANMAVSSADSTVFFQDEGKSIKRGENHHESGHVESSEESVGSVSQRMEGKRGKCYDVSYTTGIVVFIITYFHKLIHRPFDNKQTLFT